jgi:PAS domain-containing protein
MPEHAIPTTVEQVTPAWLTDALRGSGALQDGTVTGFDAELIGQGVGIMGLLHRLTPTYDGGSGPATVVLKTPVDHEMTRFVARTFQFYSKEVAFYRTAAARSPLTTPRCLASAHDPESDDFVLLLEDLGDAEAYDQLDGCPPDLAEAAVRALARHHTEFWETPSFGKELSWLPYGWDPPMPQGVQQGVTMAWEPFLAGFGDHVDEDIRAIGERFPDVVEEMMYFPGKPTTLVHGDYRLDNLFFRRHEDGPEVIAIDWQICVRSVGAYDLGYFLSQSLTIEDRRTHEERLLDVYRSTLAEADIDYPADELLEDYRRTVLFCLCYPIQAGGNIELVNDRAVQLVGLMLDRVVAAIRDLDAASLMP